MTYGSLFSGIGGLDLGFDRAGLQCLWQVENNPYALRVLQRHWPQVPKYLDVCDVGEGLPQVDVICGGFPCFVVGTLILTKQGLTPIELVKIGDEVFTHRNRWRKVTSTMSRFAEKTVTLKGGFHYGLTTTSEHPFWASGGRVKKYKPHSERKAGNWYDVSFLSPEWVNAENMEGKYWSVPVIHGTNEPPKILPVRQKDGKGKLSFAPELTEEMFWVLGVWVGDGWARRRKDRDNNLSAIIICCPENYTPELVDRLEKAGLKVTLSKDRTVNKLIISNRALAEWVVANFGEGASEKRIPGWLYEVEAKYRKAFLEGYIWTDGTEEETGWKATSVSRSLTFGLGLLATSLGMTYSIYETLRPETTVIEGRTVRQKTTYQIVVRSFGKQTSSFRLEDHVFSKCRSVKPNTPQMVYNISVEEDESYTVDGVVVHNCQDVSQAGKGAGLSGKRSGLWREFRRIVSLLRPRFVVVENVRALVRRGLSEILLELAQIGYDAQWQIIPAYAVGAPHIRERLFLVAYPCRTKPPNIFGPTYRQGRERTRTLEPTSIQQENGTVSPKGFGASRDIPDTEGGGRETDGLPIGAGATFPVTGNDGFGESNGLADPRREHGQSGDVSGQEGPQTSIRSLSTKEPERCGRVSDGRTGNGTEDRGGDVPDADGIGKPQPQRGFGGIGGRIGDGSFSEFARYRSFPFFQATTFPRLGGSVDGFPDWLERHVGRTFAFEVVGVAIETLRRNWNADLSEHVDRLARITSRTSLAELLIGMGTLPVEHWPHVLESAYLFLPDLPSSQDCEVEDYDTFDGGVPRVGTGFKNRTKRLEGLGNAVVPFIAEWIGRRLREVG